nr:hypothetical protein [Tanacetum cinerariifolium]
MDQPNPTFAKIPILDTGKFEQWKFRIQQYLQNEHYALWEVIEFGDSYEAPLEESGTGSASESSAKKKGRTVTITTKDMQKRRNDVKARTTLLLALPDEHQNEATKKTKKNQLKKQYGNFKAEGSETLEQTFNRLQAIISHLEFIDVEIERDDLNQKFLTSLALEWLMYTIPTLAVEKGKLTLLVFQLLAVGNKMHKAFPLPVMEFPLPEEVPTTSEESSHFQNKRDATTVKIALLLKSRRNCQYMPYDSFAKIQQYLQNEHYALWEVIEFGDSYEAPLEESGIGSASESSAKKKRRTVTITTKDMQKRRNDVKARTTLLLALPDEHQNEATKKTKKNQVKQQYGNFKAEGSETLEQTFNRLQAIPTLAVEKGKLTLLVFQLLAVGNKMHKAFPLPVMEFPLPEEVPTTSEESSHFQNKRDATAVKIALLLKSRRNCTTSDGTGKKKGRIVTVTADDMQKRKNDVKARTTKGYVPPFPFDVSCNKTVSNKVVECGFVIHP